MASKPIQLYFDRTAQVLRDASGNEINNNELAPFAVLGMKQSINLQVVTDSSLTAYTGYEAGCSANILVDNDYSNYAPLIDLEAGDGNWTQVGVTNEYTYAETDDITAKPGSVWINGTQATEGTVASLAAGEWGWDATELVLYLRMSDDSDPDGQTDGYIQYKPDVTVTKPFIEVDASTVNAASSWYDSGSFRNPVIANGELSFDITANTAQFYNRLSTSEVAQCIMQVQILENATSAFIDLLAFQFRCRNRFLPTGAELEVEITNFWNKTESDARYARKSETSSITWVNGVGPVITSPNGTEFLLSVEDTGQIIATEVL